MADADIILIFIGMGIGLKVMFGGGQVLYLILFVIIFVVSYGMGARHAISEAISIITVVDFFLHMSVFGVGLGVAGTAGYVLIIRPLQAKISAQKQKLEKEKDDLVREREEFELEHDKRLKAISQMAEEVALERSRDACKRAEGKLRRAIENEVEDKYLTALSEQLHGKERESYSKEFSKVTGEPPTYKAKNGKVYAHLREGEPVEEVRFIDGEAYIVRRP